MVIFYMIIQIMKSFKSKLEKAQYSACLAITGAIKELREKGFIKS